MSTPSPTAAEQDAFVWMQARLVQLLLRHDTDRFGRLFSEQRANKFIDKRLRPYRELAVLFYLRDELFESILPRIKRRLSVASPRQTQTEDMPPRGRIDWSRTITDSLRHTPGELPLTVTTRQRRRHFTTPENLLTVVTLLEYQAAVEQVLAGELIQHDVYALRHPLHEIVTACTDELKFSVFKGLVNECTTILSGHAAHSVDELAAAVEANLLPGGNSAYDDLLAWRRKLAELQLLDQTQAEELPPPMLGGDPKRDNYLYQVWLFYELGDMLQQMERLDEWDIARMQLTFRWGDDDTPCTYALQHDQHIDHHWHKAPGVRPDLYIARTDRQEVWDGDTLIWREPGYVLDAKYYRERATARAPGNPVKRMLADLHLTGERHGALLFAFQHSADLEHADAPDDPTGDEPDADRLPQPHQPLYTIAPNAAGQQTTVPDVAIGVWRVQPMIDENSQQMQQILQGLLNNVHIALQKRVEVRCHGIFLDSLNASDGEYHIGQLLGGNPEDWLVCPKPHVGAWRVDVVNRTDHCCRNAHLCHIMGHPDCHPPVRPPRTATDLLRELQQVFAGNAGAELDDATVQTIAGRVQELTRRFAEIAGVYRQIEVYANRVQDMGMHHTFHLLGEDQQQSLALAVFLVEQLDSIGAADYSAPAIHVSSVLEIENRRLVFTCPGLSERNANPKHQSLGCLPGIRLSASKNNAAAYADWQRLTDCAATHWQGAVLPDEPEYIITFDDYVKVLDAIKDIRNAAAHTRVVPRKQYDKLFEMTCRGGKLRIGALNALLLAWRAPPAAPNP